jgi:putative flippase GtrA
MKLPTSFSKYLGIGVSATLLNIGLLSLLVDLLDLNVAISTAFVVTMVFFYKFHAYVHIQLLHPQLGKFFMISGTSAILNGVFTWAIIEMGGMPAYIGSTIVIGTLFVLRFVAFKWLGMIKE